MAGLDLPLFPLHTVLFPGMSLPLHVFEERYKLMIGTCMVTDRTFGVALIRSGREVGGPAEVYEVGTTARITQIERLPEGQMNLLAVGVERFRILGRYPDQPYAVGQVELLVDRSEPVPDGLTERVQRQFQRYLLSRGLSPQDVRDLELPTDPLALSYLVAAYLKAPPSRRQHLLEEDSIAARLWAELGILAWESGGPELNPGSFSLN